MKELQNGLSPLNNSLEELKYKSLTTVNYLLNNGVSYVNSIPILQLHYDLKKEHPSLVRDDVFKLIMLSEKRKKFPCKFLSILLDMDYEDLMKNLKFLKNELDRSNIESKKNTVDFVARYKDTIFSIEMNNTNTLERNVEYASILLNQEKRNKNTRKKLCNIIQINLNNFKFNNNDNIFEIYRMQDRKGKQYYLQSFVNVLLLNLREKLYNKGINSLTRKE